MSDRVEQQRQFVDRWEAFKPPTSGAWEQKRRLAAAMRGVINRLVQSNAPEDQLQHAAIELERYADRLAGHPRLRRGDRDTPAPAEPDVGTFVDQSPITGLANPLAPPISLTPEADWCVVGRVSYDAAFEGLQRARRELARMSGATLPAPPSSPEERALWREGATELVDRVWP